MEIERGYEDYNEKNDAGIKVALICCVVEVLENLVFLCNATNFVAYFVKSMHYPIATAANMVTNFMGASFFLTIFGGLISDSFLGTFKTFIIFCCMELLGLIILTVQAQVGGLRPAMGDSPPSGSQEALLYIGLYSMATGVGGVKASLPAHGANQLDHTNQRLISSFFNWFFFSLCIGGLISSTVMVWIEENKGWNWSFNISIALLAIALAIFIMGFPFSIHKSPVGSPLTRIFKVFASAIKNRKSKVEETEKWDAYTSIRSIHEKCNFLDKSLTDDTITISELKETKTFIALLPIFASTIMMNCCLAQLLTFSVQQGALMNRKLSHNFQIPTQSLSVLPLVIMISSIPLYERFARIFTSKGSSVFDPLKRIGLGLAMASASMAVAALVEVKRRESGEKTLSVFWLLWQYLVLSLSDMLTLGGMLEFFYSEAPASMRSMSTSLSWCSTAMGFFLSSVLVSIVNSVSGHVGKEWLGGNDLNHNRLELFYTLLCVLNLVNFFNYVYWAKKY